MQQQRAHRGAALGVAVGGVLLGHWLTFHVVSPHELVRDRMLVDTGHGYLHVANDLGLMAVLAALVTVVLGNLIRRQNRTSVGRWFARIAIAGVVAFTAMEVVERLASGAPLADLLRLGLLPVGMAIQVLLAVVSALAIRWLLRAVENVQGTSATAIAPTRLVLIDDAPVGWQPALRPLPTADPIRGPPAVR